MMSFHVCSFSVSWCAQGGDWHQEQVILPKQHQGEELGEYYARLVSYLRLSHHLPEDATIILNGPPAKVVKLNPLVKQIGEWLRYGGEAEFLADKKNKGKNPPNRSPVAWTFADMIEKRWGNVQDCFEAGTTA